MKRFGIAVTASCFDLEIRPMVHMEKDPLRNSETDIKSPDATTL
jgi:hypothetical protein